ncbi:MAG: hypothetical protein JO031_15390 [Ktedonobacteraceae bacterium]|nr:hypothetical protein [Ktedonobacteraceae bacterium]
MIIWADNVEQEQGMWAPARASEGRPYTIGPLNGVWTTGWASEGHPHTIMNGGSYSR